MSEKYFPIFGSICAIPWSVIAPFEKQAIENHEQTLERLAQRGGVSPCEAVAIIEGRKWSRMDAETAEAMLRSIVDASKDLQLATLTAKLEKAYADIKTANANHEKFERLWYLEKDKLEKARKALVELHTALVNLSFTAKKLWNDAKPIKDFGAFKVEHPTIQDAEQAIILASTTLEETK